MRSILISLIIGLGLFMQGVQTKNFTNVQDAFNDCCYIEIIVDDNSKKFGKQTKEYNNIINEFNDMLKNSHQVPAFGVSLDKETRQALKSGVWIKFGFDFVGYNQEMPFEALLINVNNDFSGFNVIRINSGKYEGRCYYIDLMGNMNNLYSLLIEL